MIWGNWCGFSWGKRKYLPATNSTNPKDQWPQWEQSWRKDMEYRLKLLAENKSDPPKPRKERLELLDKIRKQQEEIDRLNAEIEASNDQMIDYKIWQLEMFEKDAKDFDELVHNLEKPLIDLIQFYLKIYGQDAMDAHKMQGDIAASYIGDIISLRNNLNICSAELTSIIYGRIGQLKEIGNTGSNPVGDATTGA